MARSKLLHEIEYCYSRSKASYDASDYVSGEFYGNEIIRMTDMALDAGTITKGEALQLRHFGYC